MNTQHFILILLITLSVFPSMAQDNLCLESGGFVDDETGDCTRNTSIEIEVDLPVEYADMPFVMDELNTVIDTETQSFIDIFIEASSDVRYIRGWFLEMHYNEVRHSDTIFTVVFSNYMFTGGAHGIPYRSSHTFDTESETILTLDDVFIDVDTALVEIAPLAVDKLTELFDGATDTDWIEDGTDPTEPENYAIWGLSEDSFIIYFSAYQVAPYVAGQPTIEIPLSELSDVLEPAFVPTT